MEDLRAILRQYWGYDDFRPLQAEAMRAVVEGRDSLGRAADRRRQESLLSGAGAGHAGPGGRRLAADLADEGSGRRAGRLRRPRGLRQQHAHRRREARDRRRDSRRATEAALSFARAAADGADARLLAAGARSRSSPSTRPTASANGATTSGPSTAGCGCSRIAFRTSRCTPTPPPPRPTSATTSSASLASASRKCSSARSTGRTSIYRVRRRSDLLRQIREVVDRHPNEPGIIYCIRRTDVEEIAAHFASLGYQALPYHAGMSDDDRRRNQDAFINDRAGSSWPPSPSAWASTNRTCAT